ncbi:MAG: tetratricopeptide repeat protein [Piscinibacter sp.]|nr:tetratricopeptide repeat protein [Piscinibacter sp.]
MASCTLVFTDLVDSTLLVGRIGDAGAADLWTAHDREARDLLTCCDGREIDRSDGFFLTFDRVADAARFALGYQRATAALGVAARVGMHHGAVTLRRNEAADVARGAKPIEVEGLAKPFAARVMALAAGGQTLLSAPARAALAQDGGAPAGTELESHGHYRLKGIDEPVELFELGVPGTSPFAPPADADKAYRVVRDQQLWRPVREVRHNLAAERDAFVGRAAELRALAQRLDAGTRLLTIVGPGGTGKTRLVTRYGHAWLGDWPGGVAFCDLSEARSIEGIHFAVALALGVPLARGDASQQLGHAIAARGRCLVILDNFEQIAAHAPATLGRWLDRAAEASFLVTSRESLHLAGEEVFAVEPLALADEAVELFAARARARQPGFEITPANRAAVADIVRLLDGLPLAIELAAARIRVLSPAQIVARLQDRFRLLAGARGVAARQATLEAAIDWSWNLLAPWEQAALAQCSVFDGGFTLEAAEALLDLSAWPEAGPAIDTVQALVDKSLLRRWHAGGGDARLDIDEPYFGMYLSIHDYAAGKLVAQGAGTLREAEERHGRFFAGLGSDDAIEALHTRGGAGRLPALVVELDNLVAACRRAAARSDGATAVATLRAAWEVLERQGPFALGAALGDQVLGLHGLDPSQRTAACLVRAVAARRLGRSAEAEPWIEEALTLSRDGGDASGEALALAQLGLLRQTQGRADESRAHLEAALALQRAAGHRRLVAGLCGNLANHCVFQGRLDEADRHYAEALTLQREVGDRRAEGGTLAGLAVVCQDQGRMEEALAFYEAAQPILHECADRMGEGIVLGNLATLHNDVGRLVQARTAYDAALAIAREIGDRVGEGVTLGNLGKLLRDLGQFDEARVHYEAALAVGREGGDRRTEGIALGGIGSCLIDLARPEQALAWLDDALEVHRGLGNRRFEGETQANRGDALARTGRNEEARAALIDGEAVLRDIGDALDLAKLLCVRGRVEVAAGDRGAAHAALAQADALAASMAALPESELGQELARLRAALG